MFARVPDAQKAERKATCAKCPQKNGPLCQLCWCPLALKIPFAGQSCPAGKW